MKQNVDKNFDGELKIYYRVEYDWWDGREKEDMYGELCSPGTPGMKYYLCTNVFKMNYELSEVLFDRHSWRSDITQKHSNKFLESLLIDSTDYCAKINEQQLIFIAKYLWYWETQLQANPESELHKRRISYLQTVRGELKFWFDDNKVDIRNRITGDAGSLILGFANQEIHNDIALRWLKEEPKKIQFIKLMRKHKLIDEALSEEEQVKIFTDEVNQEKVWWLGKQTEIAYLIKKLIDKKILGDKNIWSKITFHFINKEKKDFKASNLATAYQQANPKQKEILDDIVNELLNK